MSDFESGRSCGIMETAQRLNPHIAALESRVDSLCNEIKPLQELRDILILSRARDLTQNLPMLMELPLTREEYDRIIALLSL